MALCCRQGCEIVVCVRRAGEEAVMKSPKKSAAVKVWPDHVGVSVADLEESIAWYQDKLGFTLMRIVEIPDAEEAGRVALLRNGDFIIELFCLTAAAPLPEDRRYPTKDILTLIK